MPSLRSSKGQENQSDDRTIEAWKKKGVDPENTSFQDLLKYCDSRRIGYTKGHKDGWVDTWFNVGNPLDKSDDLQLLVSYDKNGDAYSVQIVGTMITYFRE